MDEVRPAPWRLLLGLTAAAILIHVLTNGRYGYFRDELYFLACGRHVDWGYIDHAPLIGWLAWLQIHVIGTSMHAMGLLPALSAGAKVLLTGLIARELGGRRFGTLLACLGVLLAPVYLIVDNQFSMNTFEPLVWMGCILVLLVTLRRNDPRLLVWFGAIAGVGLENKHSTLFFGFAIVVGLLVSRDRRLLWNPWMWIAGVVAVALFAPNLIWQMQHHWPTLEDLANVRRTHKNVELPPLPFLAEQVLMMGPANLLIWAPGIWSLVRSRYRFLGFAYLALLAVMMALHAKDYYVAPMYPMLFAAGGVFWESRRRWVRVALPIVVIALALPLMPVALPILPADRLPAYESVIGLKPPRTEVGMRSELPQYFSDEFGWPEMVQAVAAVYWSLPPEDRARAAIYTDNYGEAGAVDFFGPRFGLPSAISGHQTYFYWGPRQYTGDVLIALNTKRQSLEQYCDTVTDGPWVGHPLAMSWEQFRIYVCRGMHPPLPQLWPAVKHWN